MWYIPKIDGLASVFAWQKQKQIMGPDFVVRPLQSAAIFLWSSSQTVLYFSTFLLQHMSQFMSQQYSWNADSWTASISNVKSSLWMRVSRREMSTSQYYWQRCIRINELCEIACRWAIELADLRTYDRFNIFTIYKILGMKCGKHTVSCNNMWQLSIVKW